MTGRKYALIVLLALTVQVGFAQKLHVKASGEALSAVLNRLPNTEVSFDNRLLAPYRVTVDKSFSSPYKALIYLLSDKPLQVEKVAGVYVITARKKALKPNAPTERTANRVERREQTTALPNIDLTMSLKEIVITAPNRTLVLQGSEDKGTSRFNSFTPNAMPGHSDNVVFNVLRMMPGIRASGEPSDELYVWGSSPGESRVLYNGIPLYTLQSYNSNISYINPYMFNEVRYKRGLQSAYEDSQTGAKVDVTSNMSHPDRPMFKAMLTTMSANCFGLVPLGKNAQLSVAYRHSLNGWFGGTIFDAYRKRNEEEHHEETKSNGTTTTTTTTTTETGNERESTEKHMETESTNTTPDYRFQDVNLNISGSGEKGVTYHLSVYGAKDYVNYAYRDTLTANGAQTSYQGGVGAQVEKQWNNGSKSEVSAFFSGLSADQNSRTDSIGFATNERVTQYNLKMQQSGLSVDTGLIVGGEFQVYHVKNHEVNNTCVQPTLFATQKWNYKDLDIEAGLRSDFMSSGVKWQPRLLVHYRFLKYFTLTSAWGIYHQYLVKDPFAITKGYYNFSWDINDALKSYNTVAGLAFDKGGLNVSVEAYMKNIRHSQWVINDSVGKYSFNIKGIDASVKYTWRHGLVFASWSLSNDPRQTDGVSNEWKAGGILRVHAFSFSANYVYGKGYNSLLLPASSYEKHEHEDKEESELGTNYSRMDVSASYEKSFGRITLSTGASIINVFDTENRKYATTWLPKKYASTMGVEASRITPVIFIAVKFQ
jgi:hypothetical protein